MTAGKEYTYSYENGRISRAAECVITDVQGEMITTKTLVNTVFYVYNEEGTLIRKRILPADGEERGTRGRFACNTCFAVGAGFDFFKWALSNSTSNYKYCTWLNKWIQKMSSVYNYIYKKARKIKT